MGSGRNGHRWRDLRTALLQMNTTRTPNRVTVRVVKSDTVHRKTGVDRNINSAGGNTAEQHFNVPAVGDSTGIPIRRPVPVFRRVHTPFESTLWRLTDWMLAGLQTPEGPQKVTVDKIIPWLRKTSKDQL